MSFGDDTLDPANVPDKSRFEYLQLASQEAVRKAIRNCEGKHVQQVCYSSFMDCLTQICFTCQKIRSTIGWEGNRSWNREKL